METKLTHVWVLTRETPDGSDIMGIFTNHEPILEQYPQLRPVKEYDTYTSRDFSDKWGDYYFLTRYPLDVFELRL